MTTLLLVVAGGYVAFVLALAWRASRPSDAAPSVDDEALPSVVVVVAARDEADRIGRCLDALLAQDYPADRLQIVVADDHSTDGTAAVVRRYQRAGALVLAGGEEDPDDGDGGLGPEVRCVRVPDPEGHLRGKAQALHTAIASSTADIVLVTDADCAPVPTWVRGMAARFADPGAGIVCGLARIRPRPGRPFDRAQALDWTLLLGAVSTLAEAGAPATGMGNNMAVRRAAYDAVGGYPALPFSLTEDFTLVRAIADRTPWTVRFPIDSGTVVWTLPADTPAEAYRQRRRWARGGLTGDPWVIPVYAALFATHAVFLTALVALPALGLAALAAKTLTDGALLTAILRRADGRLRWADVPAFEAFLFAYLLTLPAVLLLRPRVDWKGRRH